jgi:hypothetical protein
MKWNFFKAASPLFPFRWTIVVAIMINILLVFANLSGWRLLASDTQQQWAARGPGYHK